MIEEKFVDLYAHASGIRDKLIAERDVVLTYALQALHEAGLTRHLAFKGGTCLRKMLFGASGRFSEDLDFTLATDKKQDDVFVELVDTLNQEHYGITFSLDDYYEADDKLSFGGSVLYRHGWNDAGRFRLQISVREEPTLSTPELAAQPQVFFKYLEFKPAPVQCLAPIEMISEKVRAAYQRAKVRDVYDLHRFASMPFDVDLLRALVVLKLWQVGDTFDPKGFFAKIAGGDYDWDELRKLLRSSDRIDPAAIKREVAKRYGALGKLSELENGVAADGKSHKKPALARKLKEEVRRRSSK